MSWITPTTDQLWPDSSTELAGIVAVKGADDRADVLAGVVDEFRQAAAARGHPLGPDGTVPRAWQRYVTGIACWRFVSVGVPQNEGIQSAARREANDEGQQALARIAAGEIAPELPDGYTAQNPRSGNWNSENKLLMRTHPVPPPSMQWQNQQDTSQPPYANPEGPADE
jgi:uncharacterized protein RhaS with RHS repeats